MIPWEALGFHLAGSASNGLDALQLVEQLEPDLLLTDIRMPFISGIELARQVRVLEKMPEAPTGPIVVRSNLDPEEKASLRRIFYTMHENADLLRSMKTIVIDRFVVPDTVAYERFKRQYAEQRRLAGN